MDLQKKIIWLASYPKSGNTWFRAFLSALMNNGEVDINQMEKIMFSSRQIFTNHTDLNSTYLTDKEAKITQPLMYNHLAASYKQERFYVKVHDAYTFSHLNQPIIPTESTFCAIYFVRNPLDIAGSLANHSSITIDHAVKRLADDDYAIFNQNNNLNTDSQFRQFISNWSFHVESWTLRPPFPVFTVRYEDMLINTFDTFKQLMQHIDPGKYNDNELLKAIEASSFSSLKKQEQEQGFGERFSAKNQAFFRQGEMNGWEHELAASQVEYITQKHHSVMKRYQYL
ncbi:sulfotransferase domain-containing protein [Mucilaginibacter sp. E4BP6]|uniref:sulfotransferase domain-containing protein n=1 Tax=Mucilaginibacter sp. E4BP6 TaxID=2723089 RepID=UPI0015CE29B0|nr:sulfotransferase domain-containing protein [Mucilaginibacter sp. E4BP6]NYE68251.1 hypothetical protein [Mucilaginibacter sp. E4BP6]